MMVIESGEAMERKNSSNHVSLFTLSTTVVSFHHEKANDHFVHSP